jgi:hypothetical protein
MNRVFDSARWALSLFLAGALLTACGGGGDTYTPSGGTVVQSVPAVLTLNDANERVLTANVLAPGEIYLVKLRLVPTTPNTAVANQLVTFRTDPSYAGFFPAPLLYPTSPPGSTTSTVTAVLSAITDATGVARAYLLGKAQNGSTVSAVCSPQPCVATAVNFQTYPLNAPPDSALVGVPYARGVTVASSTPSIEGFAKDGVTTTVAALLSDRYGNPVQTGTRVYWKATHGEIPTFCDVDTSSVCRVIYRTSGTRPANGLVGILAYVEGPEEFTDLNANRRYDSGEPFVDIGDLYLDRNLNGVFDPLVDERLAGGANGTSACAGTFINIANTCDGVWTAKTRLGARLILTLSTSKVLIQLYGARSRSGFVVSVTDLNGNVSAVGTTVVAEALARALPTDLKNACLVTSVVQTSDTLYSVMLNGADGCDVTPVQVDVTSPAGQLTSAVF